MSGYPGISPDNYMSWGSHRHSREFRGSPGHLCFLQAMYSHCWPITPPETPATIAYADSHDVSNQIDAAEKHRTPSRKVKIVGKFGVKRSLEFPTASAKVCVSIAWLAISVSVYVAVCILDQQPLSVRSSRQGCMCVYP